MANNLCIFAKYRWWIRYKQYPSNSFADTYSELFTKASKYQTQIIACVKDNKIYYAYLYRMRNGAVWLCFQHEKICTDFEKLFSLLNSSLNYMGGEGILLKTSKERLKLNNINLSDPKLRGKLKDYLRNLEKDLDDLISAKSDYLSNDKGGDITDEAIEYELRSKGSAYFAERINERYTVIILQSNTEKDIKRQSQTNTPQKQGSSTTDNEMDVGMRIILGVIGAIILLNLIAPWFIPSMWVKFAIVLTCLGIYLSLKALNDDTNNKISGGVGWSGFIAILLSTILTIYGLCGGLSPDTIDESENTQAVTEGTIMQDNESEHHVSKHTPVTRIPNKFVRISSGTSDFYIDRYEVTQKDYVALMGNNPSKFQGDSLPVHGMSVRDAVIYCNKKSDAEGLRGFYDISGNVVTLKSDGNGYRLPTEKEWILAARDPKKNMKNNENIYHSQQSLKIRKNSDLKPHVVGKNNSNGWGLYDMYGNVCELCVRDNGEIWGKGGGYRIVLDSETSENGGFKAAEDLSSTINLNADFGLRLVFIP